MPLFTVLKRVTNIYAVEVEADDATDAIVQANRNEHDEGDLIDDWSDEQETWEVYAGERDYPLPEKSLPVDRERLKALLKADDLTEEEMCGGTFLMDDGLYACTLPKGHDGNHRLG